jgi:uncharacterized membrane protein YuzA (DUF378 family)
MSINVVRLQDNPIVAKTCLLLLSLAAINYLFLAFNKNPLQAIMPNKTVQSFVFILIGLCGIQFFFKSFDVKEIVPTVRGWTGVGIDQIKKGASVVRKEIDTLEHYRNRNRYQCGCQA